MTLGEGLPPTDEERRRIEALFRWITNSGESYPALCEAARTHAAATFWARFATSVAITRGRAVLASAAEDGADQSPFTAREILFVAEALAAHFDQHVSGMRAAFERAMAPDPTKEGIFRNHNCWRCKDGSLPCVKGAGNERDCDTLHARND